MAPPPRQEGSSYVLVTGSGSGRATEGANIRLKEGDVLRHVSVALGATNPPVDAEILLFVTGNPQLLKAGWIRGPSTYGERLGLSWHGELPLGENPVLSVFAQNNTGSTVTVVFFWTVLRNG